MTETCRHCGHGYPDVAYGGAAVDSEAPVPLCHPIQRGRPDCYRRVTECREPLGALIGVEPKPAGVEQIRASDPAQPH